MNDPYPSLVRRYSAALIDTTIVIVTSFTIAALLQDADSTGWRLGLIAVVFFLYEPLFTSKFCTLGQYLMRLRVRQAHDPQEKIWITQAYLRILVKGLLGWYSFIAVLFSPQKRAAHDYAAASIVVEARYAHLDSHRLEPA